MAIRDWYVASDGDNSTGASWATAKTNLVSTINGAGSGDTIYIAAGTYACGTDAIVIPPGATVRGRGRSLTVITSSRLLSSGAAVVFDNDCVVSDLTIQMLPNPSGNPSLQSCMAPVPGQAVTGASFNNIRLIGVSDCMIYAEDYEVSWAANNCDFVGNDDLFSLGSPSGTVVFRQCNMRMANGNDRVSATPSAIRVGDSCDLLRVMVIDCVLHVDNSECPSEESTHGTAAGVGILSGQCIISNTVITTIAKDGRNAYDLYVATGAYMYTYNCGYTPTKVYGALRGGAHPYQWGTWTGATWTARYPSYAGGTMDIVSSPNASAITAINAAVLAKLGDPSGGSVAAAVEEVRADIQGAKAGLTPQAQGLRPMAATTDVVDATNAAAVDVACPPATTHVFVSCTGAFRFKRSAGAGVSDTYMAAGAYLLDMQCPGTAGVFSVLVVSGDATEVHVTPMGP